MNYQDYRVGQSRAKTEPVLGRLVPAFASFICCLWWTLSREATQTTGHASRDLREQAFGSGFVS